MLSLTLHKLNCKRQFSWRNLHKAIFFSIVQSNREASELKNVKKSGKSGKSPLGGERDRQKKINSKFGLLIRGGGGYILIFFPNVNEVFKCFSWTKYKLVLKWFLGTFKCFKLMFFFWRGEGSKNSKFSQFQIFPKLGTGGVIKFRIFPKFKKVQNILGEGVQDNCGLFPFFVTFFNSEASLYSILERSLMLSFWYNLNTTNLQMSMTAKHRSTTPA